MKYNAYLFSGLGADERVFARMHLQNCRVRHIVWPRVAQDTSKDDFLQQISAQITTRQNNVLLGVSFGGLVAQNIASILPPEKLIIVSSVADSAEIPRLYRSLIARWLLKLAPGKMLTTPNAMLNFLFSVETEDGRKTLHDVIRDSDPAFIRWAVAYLQQWRRPDLSQVPHVYRIHGEHDRIFPHVPRQAAEIVPGGHFAIYESAVEINRLLKGWI